MTMRALIDDMLTSDEVLLALIPKERWLENTAVKDSLPRLFAAYRWGEMVPALRGPDGRRAEQSFNLYVHDDPGSYNKINQVLTRARAVLLDGPGRVGFGANILGVDWRGSGPDGVDEAHRTAVRYETFRIVGTGM